MLLWTKVHILLSFPEFWPLVPFLSQEPMQDPTQHQSLCLLWVLLAVAVFSDLPRFWWPWQFWQVLVVYFVWCFSTGIYMVFSHHRLGVWMSEHLVMTGTCCHHSLSLWCSSPSPGWGSVYPLPPLCRYQALLLYTVLLKEVPIHTCRGGDTIHFLEDS